MNRGKCVERSNVHHLHLLREVSRQLLLLEQSLKLDEEFILGLIERLRLKRRGVAEIRRKLMDVHISEPQHGDIAILDKIIGPN